MMDDTTFERELRLRDERARALGAPLILTRELVQLPDGEGWLRLDVVPNVGVRTDEAWLEHIPARSRLRLTRRWETRYVYPIPDGWSDMPPERLARLWQGAEPS